ncbi:MAG TPA: NUDIX hydrolase [Xanthobacteraceae bacterium]|nr:NUDIX hydrolase [Xanthobacteraceae bacterium]
MSGQPAAARPASTILLLRDGKSAIEVFMMVRHYQIEFASGALVFPGGSVDPGDRDIVDDPVLCGQRDGFDAMARQFRVAAIRETFEESGILLARPRGSQELIAASRAAAIADAHRGALCEGKISFREILSVNELTPAIDLLAHYAHWITPEGQPKRFDTHFFLAKAPPEQVGAHDGRESTDSIWVSPQDAVQGGETGRFKLPFPTTRNLIRLGKQPTVAAAIEDARRSRVVTVMPVVTRDGDTRRLKIPADAGYDGELFEIPKAG